MKLVNKTIRPMHILCMLAACTFVGLGCVNSAPPKVVESNKEDASTDTAKHDENSHDHAHDDVAMAMAKLSPEDRELAEAQGYCVVGDGKLGGMGVPVKLMIQDKPVFICCEHCKEKAEKDPAATLAKVEEMKQKTTTEKSAVAPAKTEEAPKASEPAMTEMKKEETTVESKPEEPKKQEPAKEEPKQDEPIAK